MRTTILTLFSGLVATTLATPSHHSQLHRSGHNHHHASHYGTASGMPFPIGNATAMGGSSGFLTQVTTTSTEYTTSTRYVTAPTANDAQPVDAAAQSASIAAQPKNAAAAAEAKVAENQPAADADACNQATVTVTYTPTTTVTANAAPSDAAPAPAESAQSQPSSAPVEAAPSSPASPSSAPPANSPVVAADSHVSSAPQAAPSSSSLAATVPAAASSSKPQPPTAASPANAGLGSKRGIIATGTPDFQRLTVAAFAKSPKISWLVDWFSAPPDNVPSTMQFVPQDYSKQQTHQEYWGQNAKKAVDAGQKYFLGFGEPTDSDPTINMDPQDAVNLWMANMKNYTEQGVSVGAPGTLQDRIPWLQQFLELCDQAGCKIGFLAMHWFYNVANKEDFKNTYYKFQALAKGKPIWVDNFHADGTLEEQKAFLQEMVPWLDQQEQVARYAYVPTTPPLVNPGGGLAELGEYYANL